jgi:hypothetical protein
MNRTALAIVAGCLPGLAGLAVGGYFIVTDVIIGPSGSGCANRILASEHGTMTVAYDGKVAETDTEDACHVADSISGSPELSYSGPGACAGQIFQGSGDGGEVESGIVDWFRYSSQDAFIVSGIAVYHFIHGPRLVRGLLVFDQVFQGQRITVTVTCPPPPPSGPLLRASY